MMFVPDDYHYIKTLICFLCKQWLNSRSLIEMDVIDYIGIDQNRKTSMPTYNVENY